jgi:hypothetical protein
VLFECLEHSNKTQGSDSVREKASPSKRSFDHQHQQLNKELMKSEKVKPLSSGSPEYFHAVCLNEPAFPLLFFQAGFTSQTSPNESPNHLKFETNNNMTWQNAGPFKTARNW